MSIKKQSKKTGCKVTFRLPKEMAQKAKDVRLVGDFNSWDTNASPMKKNKDGSFTTTMDLETGHEYQYRYLIDGTKWENDSCADKYVPSPFGGAENSVLVL